VSLAMRMSMASDKVTMSSVGAAEFPEVVRKARISGVPKIVVNEKVEILGAQPETIFVEALRRLSEQANPREESVSPHSAVRHS
jgi:predicted DsbA family dithiol-disulfide isomerase